MRTIHVLIFCLIGFVYSNMLHARDAYLFINSHSEQHKLLANQVNSYLLNLGNSSQEIMLVDISDEPLNFLGELIYIHDKEGRLLSEFMPHQIPAFVEVNDKGDITHHNPSVYLEQLVRSSAK